jgi:cytochrome c556
MGFERIRNWEFRTRTGSTQGEGLMNRLLALTGVLALAILVSSSVIAAEDGVKTGAIMKACFGKNGLCKSCIDSAKAKEWEAAGKTAKEFYKCIENLPKGDPKKGDKEDFQKKAKEFVKRVKALEGAIGAKDEKKFGAAVKGVTGSCMACHKAHR